MTEKDNLTLKDYTVFNSNFYSDVVRFMELRCSEEEAKKHIEAVDTANQLSEGQSLKERLNAFIDRIEFISHLSLISKFAVQSEFTVLGQEVNGIHWDIKALRLYLALTCIDIFCNQDAHKSYFENAFKELTGSTAKLIRNSLTLRKTDGTTGNNEELGLFFYNVRNFYTHTGRRFHILEDTTLQQANKFLSGTIRNKEEQYLIVEKGINLIDILLRVAISIAKQRFNWQLD